MKQTSMTALISAFARAYHFAHNRIRVFDDGAARLFLSEQEYHQIGKSMAEGIRFFDPGFAGNEAESLRRIVDHQLSPSPLGRSAFTEQALKRAVISGTEQYLIFAAGYDSFAFRQPEWALRLHIFELDHPLMSAEKQNRAEAIFGTKPDNLTYLPVDLSETAIAERLFACPAFDRAKLSFCSLLGISYYLSRQDFKNLIQGISGAVCAGSTLVFDYPDQDTYTEKAGGRAKKQVLLAGGAGEAMLASYSCSDIEALLSKCGLSICAHLTPEEITKEYFTEYNRANPQHIMSAFDNVNYCLAKKRKA